MLASLASHNDAGSIGVDGARQLKRRTSLGRLFSDLLVLIIGHGACCVLVGSLTGKTKGSRIVIMPPSDSP